MRLNDNIVASRAFEFGRGRQSDDMLFDREGRVDHDPITLEPLGLLLEEDGLNLIRNETLQGAALGSPSVAPEHWVYGDGPFGAEIEGIGEIDRRPVNLVRFRGNLTSPSTRTLVRFEVPQQIPAAKGDAFTLGCFLAVPLGIKLPPEVSFALSFFQLPGAVHVSDCPNLINLIDDRLRFFAAGCSITGDFRNVQPRLIGICPKGDYDFPLIVGPAVCKKVAVPTLRPSPPPRIAEPARPPASAIISYSLASRPRTPTVVLSGRSPRGHGVDQVLWQCHGTSENDLLRVARSADRSLRLIVMASGVEQTNLALDTTTLPDDTDFKTAFSLSADGIRTSLDGREIIASGPISMPDLDVEQFGRGLSEGTEWGGSLKGFARLDRVVADDDLRALCLDVDFAPLTGNREIVALGDSFQSGVLNCVYWYKQLYYDTGRLFFNAGVSGETSTQIKTRLFTDRHLISRRDRVHLIIAGRNDKNMPAQETRDNINAMADVLSAHGRFGLESVYNNSAEPKGSAGYDNIMGHNHWLSETFGDRFVDTRSAVVAAYNSRNKQDALDYERDIPPSSLRADTTHINTAANVGPRKRAIQAWLKARRY